MPRWPKNQTQELICICGNRFRVGSKPRKFCSRDCFFSSPSFNPGNMKGKKQTDEAIRNRTAKTRGLKRSGIALANIKRANSDPNNRLHGKDHPNWRPGAAERRSIKKTCHGFIWNAIGRMPSFNADEIIQELGWSPRQLQEYLAKRFQPGMLWENHGIRGWHIDHIRPISSFPIGTSLAEINALENLQPLWAKENLSKGRKWK